VRIYTVSKSAPFLFFEKLRKRSTGYNNLDRLHPKELDVRSL